MDHQAAATITADAPSVQATSRLELVERHLDQILFLDPDGTYLDEHRLGLEEILELIIDAGPLSTDVLCNVIDAADKLLSDWECDEFEPYQLHGEASPITAKQREALKLAIVASNLPLREPEERDRAAE